MLFWREKKWLRASSWRLDGFDRTGRFWKMCELLWLGASQGGDPSVLASYKVPWCHLSQHSASLVGEEDPAPWKGQGEPELACCSTGGFRLCLFNLRGIEMMYVFTCVKGENSVRVIISIYKINNLKCFAHFLFSPLKLPFNLVRKWIWFSKWYW